MKKNPNVRNSDLGESLPVLGEKLTFALLFFDRGVHVALCQAGSKAFIPGQGPRRGWIESDEQLYNALHVQRFNYAFLTGTGKGDLLAVIDFDDLDVYELWRAEAGSYAESFTVRTARGVHVYFWVPEARSWKGEGFEVMGKGKAVLGPMSVHPSGDVYRPLNQPHVKRLESLETFSLLSVPPIEESSRPRGISLTTPIEGGVLARIKAKHRLFDVITARPQLERQIGLKSTDGGKGRWFLGRCPFHKDKKPSMWIDAQRNLFGCYSCNVRGDVINFLARLDGWDERALIVELAKGLGDESA